jgi:hypothetical protein
MDAEGRRMQHAHDPISKRQYSGRMNVIIPVDRQRTRAPWSARAAVPHCGATRQALRQKAIIKMMSGVMRLKHPYAMMDSL